MVFKTVVLAVFAAAAASAAQAQDATVKVPATAMPWDLKANPNLPYGKGDGTAPAAADGLKLKAGMVLHIQATGSTTTVAGGGGFGPDGQADFVTDDHLGGSGRPFPSMVINPAFYPVHLNELVAVFTDSHGKVVKAPFPPAATSRSPCRTESRVCSSA